MKQETIATEATVNLLAIAKAYARATGLALTTVGRKFHGRQRFFLDLRSGKRSVTVANLADILQEFSDKWPAGLPWPETRPLSMARPPARGKKSTAGENLMDNSAPA